MPFISPESRFLLASGKDPETVGDICYLYYQRFIRRWKETPRWTTAHNIYKEWALERTCPGIGEDEIAAGDLAWQVFFALHVLPYEIEKRAENGEVE